MFFDKIKLLFSMVFVASSFSSLNPSWLKSRAINGIERSARKHMTEQIRAANAFYFIMKSASYLRL